MNEFLIQEVYVFLNLIFITNTVQTYGRKRIILKVMNLRATVLISLILKDFYNSCDIV